MFNFIVCSGMFDDHQDTYVTNRMFYVKNSNKHQTMLQGCMNKVTFDNDGWVTYIPVAAWKLNYTC